jgi:anti-sigma28 factor (negative regulator of flagellin synthesis)
LTLEEEFWSYVDKKDENDCWNWIGWKDKNGYGYFHSDRAHRYSYKLHNNNKNIKNLVVRHACDNPSCVNPKHLLIGTHNDNVQDRVKKNRSAIGEHNGRSKLKEKDVLFILQDKELTTEQLGEKFNVDSNVVLAVKRRTKWKHIKYDEEIIIPAQRYYKGSEIKSSKLNEEKVKEIKQKLFNGEKVRKLGREYGVDHSVISDIKNNKLWKHVII